MLKNTQTTIGLLARIIHWAMAIMVISIIGIGFYMTDLPNSDDKWFLYNMHKSTGLLILALLCFRIFWRFTNKWPVLPDNIPHYQKIASRLNIFLLYFLMFTMTISGSLGSLLSNHAISFFGLFTIPAILDNKEISRYLWDLHSIAPWILIAAITLHFIASLYHHLLLKDNVLRRMWLGK
jgi:cytochrome b561